MLKIFGWHNIALILFAIEMLWDSAMEIIEEFVGRESWLSMVDDVLLLLLGLAIVVWVSVEAFRTRSALLQLQKQQAMPTHGLAKDDQRTQEAAQDYNQAVNKHFEQWKLTPSERVVAVSLLKGMSFQEIALLRDSREKTVRQHASTVYRKSGLAGRHELAAWFFEDLLSQN